MDVTANTPEHEPDSNPLLDGPEDLGPEPELDPVTDRRIRELLASDPDPGPLPAAFADRIGAALAEEARLRVDPGPLARRGAHTLPSASTSATDPAGGLDDRVLVPLVRQRQKRSPLFAAAAVAAAAVVVAVGGSALHLNKRPDAVAAVGANPSTSASADPGTGATQPHIQLSTTSYNATNLTTRARALLTSPGPPLHDLAAEAPSIGPIATPIGLTSCLDAIPATNRDQGVSVDLATYDGRPAAIIVTRSGGAAVAYVVERSCTTGNPGIIQGATPLP